MLKRWRPVFTKANRDTCYIHLAIHFNHYMHRTWIKYRYFRIFLLSYSISFIDIKRRTVSHYNLICLVAYTSGTAISERLGKHSEHHNVRMKEFSDDLSDLGSVHKQTNDKVDTVHGKVLNLRAELKRMERKMDGELQKRLSNVRSVLLGALDKAQKDITEIRNDVEKGMA